MHIKGSLKLESWYLDMMVFNANQKPYSLRAAASKIATSLLLITQRESLFEPVTKEANGELGR